MLFFVWCDACQVEVSSNNTFTICPLSEAARGERSSFVPLALILPRSHSLRNAHETAALEHIQVRPELGLCRYPLHDRKTRANLLRAPLGAQLIYQSASVLALPEHNERPLVTAKVGEVPARRVNLIL